jgi:amicyanin
MNTMGAPGGWRMPAYGNNTGGYAAQAMPAPATTPQPQTVMSRDKQAPAADAITVRIDGMRFEPATIKVKPGTTVTWVQNSSMPHTVNGGMDNMRSSTLYNGQSYSFTFDETGSFDYVCDFHPSMKGSVIVEEAGTRT